MSDPLITLEEVRFHLKVTNTDEDTDLMIKIASASDLVVQRITSSQRDATMLATIAAWDEDTVPEGVRAAILTQAAELYRFRGDDKASDEPKGGRGRLSDRVERYLQPWIDPGVA